MTLTAEQLRELNVAVRHLGRAMNALRRADLPYATGTEHALMELNRGERLVGQASDKLIDGLMAVEEEDDGQGHATAHGGSDHKERT